MLDTKAVATPPGQPTSYVNLTPEEALQKQQDANATPVVPFIEQIRMAFASLPIELQTKYKDEIRDAAFFLERDNIPMVQVVIQEAALKLDMPDEQAVQDIITAALAYLGGS